AKLGNTLRPTSTTWTGVRGSASTSKKSRWVEGSARCSGLDELVDHGPRQQPGRRNGRVEVGAAPVLESEAVHLPQPRDRLSRPAVDVPPLVGHVKEIPDDLLHVVGIRHRHDPQTAGAKYAVDLAGGVVSRRGMLEDLDHEH